MTGGRESVGRDSRDADRPLPPNLGPGVSFFISNVEPWARRHLRGVSGCQEMCWLRDGGLGVPLRL